MSNSDLRTIALSALAAANVPVDVQELLLHGNARLGVASGALDKVIEALTGETELKVLREALAAHEFDKETLIGYVSAEDECGSDPDHPWSESVFISDRKTELYEYPVYRAPVTRNRILEGVQAICDEIIKPTVKGDPDTDFWRANAAREICEKIDALKNHEFFAFERTEVHLIEHEDDAFLAVRNMLVPSFTGLYVIARRPKLMTNDEWRPVAQTIIDALRRKGPVNYPVTKAGSDI
ncbi:hypothetical protein [Mesorhizobium sp. SP-1A]|uniref:hypothetical protein n=1 Tax=Mesorhizobium sp. SP-1A TaxID=3077840 RepID=UPI0028F7283A|nr:hypothetical protein [Mesorhizobium sp. SP-1A]